MEDKQLEFETVENKTISGNKLSSDLWETITAFSNADGGLISLGIDPRGNRVGVNPNFIDKLQTDVVTLCNSGFNHLVTVVLIIDCIQVLVPIKTM